MSRNKESQDEIRKILAMWVDSDLKVQVVLFYRNNPGVIETLEGLARRIGTNPDALRKEIAPHLELGVIRQRKANGFSVLIFDRKRDTEVRSLIEKEMGRRAAGGKT